MVVIFSPFSDFLLFPLPQVLGLPGVIFVEIPWP